MPDCKQPASLSGRKDAVVAPLPGSAQTCYTLYINCTHGYAYQGTFLAVTAVVHAGGQSSERGFQVAGKRGSGSQQTLPRPQHTNTQGQVLLLHTSCETGLLMEVAPVLLIDQWGH